MKKFFYTFLAFFLMLVQTDTFANINTGTKEMRDVVIRQNVSAFFLIIYFIAIIYGAYGVYLWHSAGENEEMKKTGKKKFLLTIGIILITGVIHVIVMGILGAVLLWV